MCNDIPLGFTVYVSLSISLSIVVKTSCNYGTAEYSILSLAQFTVLSEPHSFPNYTMCTLWLITWLGFRSLMMSLLLFNLCFSIPFQKGTSASKLMPNPVGSVFKWERNVAGAWTQYVDMNFPITLLLR